MLVREIYEKGQLVIPKEIREMLGFGEGTRVVLSIEGGKLVIERETPIWEKMKALAMKTKVTKKQLDWVAKHGYEEMLKERAGRAGIRVP